MLTADGKAASLKDFDYACRGAGRQGGAARLQATGVHGMKTIYILFRQDCVKQCLGVDLLRQGQLDENSVDVVAVIERVNKVEHLFGGYGFGRRDEFTEQTQVSARLHLASDVDLGGGYIAHQYCCQTGPNSLRCEEANLFGY